MSDSKCESILILKVHSFSNDAAKDNKSKLTGPIFLSV